MPVVLEAGWTGRRVVVRRVVERAPDGRLLQADVVGDLVGLDAQTAVIEAREGLVEVPVALVTAAKLAPPSTRDELDLQAVAARGLRAAHVHELDGWTLRADAPGGPRRVNSVLPLAQLRLPLDDALARAREWYAAQDRPVVVLVPYPARRLLDAALGERGWHYETAAEVLTTRLDRVPRPGAGDVTLADAPDDAWLGLTGADHALVTRHDTVAFATVRSAAGDVLGVARGTVDDRWLGLTDVGVAPAARRTGVASRLTAALAAWGEQQGARRAYLQVEADNDAARALYAGLGFAVHHGYHYRREP